MDVCHGPIHGPAAPNRFDPIFPNFMGMAEGAKFVLHRLGRSGVGEMVEDRLFRRDFMNVPKAVHLILAHEAQAVRDLESQEISKARHVEDSSRPPSHFLGRNSVAKRSPKDVTLDDESADLGVSLNLSADLLQMIFSINLISIH